MLPAARSFQSRAVLIPGVANATFSGVISLPTVHGSSQTEAYTYNDGMRASGMNGDGNIMLGWALNDAASAELTFETGSQTAEMQVGGVLMNAVPKEGGNTFAGTWFAYGAGGGLQSDNRTAELREIIQVTDRLGHTFETNPAFGGPIRRNKLWFFGATRHTRTKNYVSDVYFPDGSQAHHTGESDSALLRLTSQLTQNNKVRVSFDKLASGNPRNSVGNNRRLLSGRSARLVEHLPAAELQRGGQVDVDGDEQGAVRDRGLDPIQQVDAPLPAGGRAVGHRERRADHRQDHGGGDARATTSRRTAPTRWPRSRT